ncbi:MATE family efflux transporter [Bradyrhizobium sp. SSUT77]|uniref:MATE family efflux transporter n=1 Tax=Bradyrhizobium sp. SSUT77 TaxID=3040603 RepID=UPI002449D393|nr:MATE family efflux transporter [Bradyrhizobium sp. SSUT77]MDH2348875.1 MATE family efflux transporter [Bradyrhizobium sp. SSUT77]
MHKSAKTRLRSASQLKLTRRKAGYRLVGEFLETARLAFPMVLTQLGQVAMTTIDVAFIAQNGNEALAAAALASRLYFVCLTCGVGVLAAIAPLVAQAFGRHNLAIVRLSLRMGLWAALLLSCPIVALLLRAEEILFAFGQAPEAARLAQRYLLGLAWGTAPTLSFQAIRSFMGAVNKPRPILWITLAAIPMNALLVYLLMDGKFGLPRLDLFGVGLATTLVNCGMFLAGLWFATMQAPFRAYHLLAHFWRFDWPMMRQLFAIGTPISMAFLMGYGTVSATALMAGRIGTSALAAHQIAAQVASILFMVPLGISTAAAVRVSYAVGCKNWLGMKQAGLIAMVLGTVVVGTLTLAVVPARFYIAELFLGRSGARDDATIALCAKLHLVGASYFITDALQSIAAGALRGLKDTRVPLLFAAVAYWPIGLSISFVLGLKFDLGAVGIWIGLSVGTTVYAGLLVLRFQLLTSKTFS